MVSFSFFLFILWEAKNDDKLIAENWATLSSSYQFTNGGSVHDARSFHRVAFEPWINIRQFRHLQPTNKLMKRVDDTLVGKKLQWKERSPTCANRSMVRRKRRARSPSSMAHSIIISLHVRPEAQASTMPANWLSRQQGIYKPTISLQRY